MIFLLCNAIRHTVLKGVKTKMSKESKAEKKAAKAEKKAAKKANKQPASPEIVKAAVSAITAVICVVAIVLTSVSITNKICETNLSIAKENPASNGSVVNGDVDPGTVDPGTPADPGAVDPDTPADPGTTDPATPTDPGTTDPATPSGGNSGSGTANNSSSNTSTGAPVGKDIAKIVAYYNAAANATKAYKGTMKLTIEQGSTSKITETNFPSAAVSIAEGLLPNDYPTNKTFTVTNGNGVGKNLTKKTDETKSINDILPIDDNPKMSTLVAAGVQSASCSKVSNGYKVVIKLKAETVTSFSQKPKHHSSCMDVLDITDEDIKPFTAKSMTIKYTGATLTAVVNDKNMLASFNVNEPMDISGSLEWGLIKGKAKIAASWKQDVKFAY